MVEAINQQEELTAFAWLAKPTDVDLESAWATTEKEETSPFKTYVQDKIKDLSTSDLDVQLDMVQESRPNNSFVDIVIKSKTDADIDRDSKNVIREKLISIFPDIDPETISVNWGGNEISFRLDFNGSVLQRLETKPVAKPSQEKINNRIYDLNMWPMARDWFLAKFDAPSGKIVFENTRGTEFYRDESYSWYDPDPNIFIKKKVAKDIGNFNNRVAYDLTKISVSDADVDIKTETFKDGTSEKRVIVKKYSIDPNEYATYYKK